MMNFDTEGVVSGFRLFPIGETKLTLDKGDMILTLSESDIQAIVARASSANLLTPIDGDHFLHHLAKTQNIDEDQLASSAPYSQGMGTLGFGSLTKKADGVWIDQIKWNPTARFLLKNGQYKYFSPVIKGLDKRSPLRITSVALTNTPRTQNISEIAASDDSASIPDGVDEESWKEAKKLTNLASTARLNLVLQQNADMANAVGQYMTSTDPDIAERYPYWRYRSESDARPEHKAFDGKIFKKDDPIWTSIYPPRDFNCRCWVEDVGDEDLPNGQYKAPTVKELNYAKTPNESGFSFNPKEAFENISLNSVQTAQHRVDVLSKMKQVMAEEHGLKRFSVIGKQPDPKLYSENPVEGEASLLSSFGEMQKDVEDLFKNAGLPITTKELLSGEFDYKVINKKMSKSGVNPLSSLNAITNKFPEQISIGTLPKETLENIGFLSNENKIILTRGTEDAKNGLTHLWRNHKDMILNPEEASKILAETIGNRSAQTAVSMTKDARKGIVERLVLFNEKKGSYCVLDKEGDHFEIVSFHRAELEYGERQWKRIQK